ncbi:hypothetical protein Pint_20699 [Pistacia integerrima]|uniref:Uncharacterized protein n=1 Tax=Pistacia integerrima TaxID=434235 RepID=A0ACC0XCP6_9ROSI|nr:hypothetical protein Pint_20699 [Pistacia integerrima]
MVGEIGGTNNNYARFQCKTFEEVKAMVLDVVQATVDAATLQRIMEYRAR